MQKFSYAVVAVWVCATVVSQAQVREQVDRFFLLIKVVYRLSYVLIWNMS